MSAYPIRGKPAAKGDGFAVKFTTDTGLDAHPAVIFADNFGTGELGARWNAKGAGQGKAIGFAPAGGGKSSGNQFLPEPQDIIAKGRWICAEFMLRENTPGQPDGEQAFLDRWPPLWPLARHRLAQ